MRIILDLDDTLGQKLKDLEDDLSLGSRTATVRYCINVAHQKLNPAYSTKQQKQLLTPEERVARQMEREEKERNARQNVIYAKGKAFCDMLGGTIVENGNGLYGCVYKEYVKLNQHYVSVYEQKVPLENLSQDYVDRQYRDGTKEEIHAILKKMEAKTGTPSVSIIDPVLEKASKKLKG